MLRSKSTKKRAVGRKPTRMVIPHPPPVGNLNIVHSTRLRFVTNTAVSSDVTFQNLLDLILVGSGATTLADLFAQVRLRRISVWSTPAIGGVSTIEIKFQGATAGAVGDYKVHTDSSMGIEPAYLSVKPARMSQAAQFQISSADIAFVLTAPTGSVVDVELSFRGVPALAVASQNAGVAVTAGAWYFRGLDGVAIATTKYTPVSSVGTI